LANAVSHWRSCHATALSNSSFSRAQCTP
jgi:hypothetical protein